MIHYHGGPITPISAGFEVWDERHAMVSFAYPDQDVRAAEWAQSFVFDNGAYTKWKQDGGRIDLVGYYRWVDEWRLHPGFDWAVIPDVIDGTEAENDAAIEDWPYSKYIGVPVWHMHESLDRLGRLAGGWHRIALGSSGEFAEIGTGRWWSRMNEAMAIVCDDLGRAKVKMHGLRMLDNTIKAHLPLSSGDSTSAAIQTGFDHKRTLPFREMPKDVRAYTLARRFQRHASAPAWDGGAGIQKNIWLNG